MKHRLLIWLLSLIAGVANLSAQQQYMLRGVVEDSSGEPLTGTSVKVKNSQTGVIADIDGNFAISVKNGEVLTFSYIGYLTTEIKVNGQNNLKIVLEEDVQNLEEVVVVGYGTMRKKDLTGSVIQIRPDERGNEASKTIQDLLRGTAGLKISMDASAKGGGSIKVRGERSMSSLTDGSPLIIVDNMPFYGELSEINPETIGQIDVLKDASAAAVYGARAANGVIIITTKQGKQGKPVINFSAKVGIVQKSVYPEVYDADGYTRFHEDWYKSATYGFNPETGNYEAYQTGKIQRGFYERPDRLPEGLSIEEWRSYTKNAAEATDMEIYAQRLMPNCDETLQNNLVNGKSFDWYDYAFRTGVNQDYNVSVSGASDRADYYMSVGYLKAEGTARGNDFHTLRASMKVNTHITNWLDVSGNVNFQDRSDGDLSINIAKTVVNSPFGNYRNENGELEPHPLGERNPRNRGYNYDFDRQYQELERGYRVLNSIFTARVNLPFNIKYSFNISPRLQWYYNRYFQSTQHPDWTAVDHGADRNEASKFDWSLNNTLNWDYTFNRKHHVTVTLVQEMERHQKWSTSISANNLQPSDALGFHLIDVANKINSSFSSSDSDQSAVGFLARAFYSFDNRYMLTASVRRDGYSAFGENKPYANFPSLALGWVFTNEKWFKFTPMNYGKIRASWGQNGNRAVNDPYLALATLKIGDKLHGFLDRSGNLVEMEYLKIGRMANPNLKWEKSEAWNFGLDFGFLNSRISGAIEAYSIYTKDMILNRSLPSFTGFDEIATNLGEVQNKGFEITLNTQNIIQPNFEWNTEFSFSYNDNKIKHIYYEYEDVLDANGNVIGSKEKDEYGKWFIGRNIAQIWDYKVLGIWRTDEAAEAALVGQRPGDPKVANLYTEDDKIDANGNRIPVYNDKDKTFLGVTSSPIIMSMRNSFKLFKNIDFSFNLLAQFGAKMSDKSYLNQEDVSGVDYGANVTKKPYWTPENPSGTYAQLNSKGPTGLNSPARYIDRGFVRLENISIGYSFPSSLLAKMHLNNLRIYGSVRNAALWTVADWKLNDIETGGLANRTYSLGINLTL